MTKYLRNFSQHSGYETYISGDYDTPNVSYCIEQNHVHYNPIPTPFNGHEYVDFGLPSGTLWAKYNVGSTNELDPGLYFATGETVGYRDATVKNFTLEDYKFYDTTTQQFTKYTGELPYLEPEDDAATVNMGGLWHMPNSRQIRELLQNTFHGYVDAGNFYNCGYQWQDDVWEHWGDQVTANIGDKFGSTKGYLFYSKDSTIQDALSNDQYIFIPAAGYAKDSAINNSNFVYLRGTPFDESLPYGLFINYYGPSQQSTCSVYDGYNSYADNSRQSGFSIRGCVGKIIEIDSYRFVDGNCEVTLKESLSSKATDVKLCIQPADMSSEEYEEVPLTSSDNKVWTAEGVSSIRCATVTIKYTLDGKTLTIPGWSSGCLE